MSELPPAGRAAHVLVADLGALEVDDATWHHLTRVRRLAGGDRCTVTDGRGRWRTARIGSAGVLDADGPVVEVERLKPELTVAFALTKGDRPETVVQKLTELGVDRIVPFQAARSVVRWDESKAAAQHARWTEIARNAVEQSHSCWMPEIVPLATLRELVGLGATRVDRGGVPPSLARPVLAVGPEGGWDPGERQALPDAVALGPNVLRAETAAITAGGVMSALRSGLVDERPEIGHAQ